MSSERSIKFRWTHLVGILAAIFIPILIGAVAIHDVNTRDRDWISTRADLIAHCRSLGGNKTKRHILTYYRFDCMKYGVYDLKLAEYRIFRNDSNELEFRALTVPTGGKCQ